MAKQPKTQATKLTTKEPEVQSWEPDVNRFEPPKFKAPILGANITPSALVDELGMSKALENYFKKSSEFYKTALRARMGTELQAQGEIYVCTVDPNASRAVFDYNGFIDWALKEGKVTQEEVNKFYTTTSFETVRTTFKGRKPTT